MTNKLVIVRFDEPYDDILSPEHNVRLMGTIARIIAKPEESSEVLVISGKRRGNTGGTYISIVLGCKQIGYDILDATTCLESVLFFVKSHFNLFKTIVLVSDHNVTSCFPKYFVKNVLKTVSAKAVPIANKEAIEIICKGTNDKKLGEINHISPLHVIQH